MGDIIIVGYGKMGKEIHNAANSRNVKVRFAVDPVADASPFNFRELGKFLSTYKYDLGGMTAVDFTEPKSALDNIKQYCKYGMNFVIGTTGEWRNDLDAARKMVEDAGITAVHGSNFSTKVHVFMIMNRVLASMLNDIPNFDVSIVERHHPMKKDPSGTGTTMAKDIISAGYFGKTELLTELAGALAPNQIMMAVSRLAGIVGEHEIRYTDDARDGSVKNDTITISEVAGNRSGFANGALDAVKYIEESGKAGFVDYADVVMARFKPLIINELNRSK
ncbi:MAG: hypothetical protein LBG89_01475 [Rickettsiales bacterium]|nr:hypothetical protein [Rickettsiales bacterium]